MSKQVLVILPLLLAAGCFGGEGNDRVNGDVRVAAGQPAADASTVNGSIDIAADATVGDATTVNGSVTLGARARAASLETVNGKVTVGEGAQVSGGVTTVNGAITLHAGADVAGAVTNVNGRLQLEAAHVGGGIHTVGGDVTVGAGSRVEGGIEFRPTTGFSISFVKRAPVIVIGPGAVVQGPLKFAREVKLYVSDRATIGEVSGAEAVRFSGDRPPE